MIMHKYLFLFDIDGTILNMKRGLALDLFANMIEELFGVRLKPEDMPSFHGQTDLQILYDTADRAGIAHRDLEAKLEIIWDYLESGFNSLVNPDTICLLPGIEELISKLNNSGDVFLSLLTGNFERNAKLKLKVHGLDKYFSAGAFGNDNKSRNELPMIAIRRANIMSDSIFDVSNTLIIGDTARDIECAKVNGIKSVSVATGGVSSDKLLSHSPSLHFEDFSDTDLVIGSMLNVLNGNM